MRFTVIIATCDRPDRLGPTLDAVAQAIKAAGEPHRLVIVDNGGRRPAIEVVAGFAARTGLDACCVASVPYQRSKAMNAGVAAATTPWLAFTDDDTLPDRDWLRCAARYAETSGCALFGGRVEPGEPDGPLPRWLRPTRAGELPGHVIFVRYKPMAVSGPLGPRAPLPLGANFFVRADLFAKHGAFDEAMWDLGGVAALGGEDTEFMLRVQQAGAPLGYCHEALVVHPVHHERCRLRSQVKLAYYFGWREPLVFFDARRRRFEPYRVPRMLRWAAGAMSCACRGRSPDAVSNVLKLARGCGEIAGVWSAAYRARLARAEKEHREEPSR